MKKTVETFIKDYVKGYKKHHEIATEWDEPAVAFADANDPLFRKLKQVVDINHLLPSDLLRDAKTVISFFIPFVEKVALSNSKCKTASDEWALAYTETNQLIMNLNESLSVMLKNQGFKSAFTQEVARNFDKKNLISYWSHKSIAFIAGLGKFGIHNMIITERGCCGRLGSIITDAEIEPTKRKSEELCLYKVDKSCGLCVKNCLTGILKVDSLDKQGCYKICLKNAEAYSSLGLADVCGKCISSVPCSFRNPMKTIN